MNALSQLKTAWQRQATRIDALSLRERAIMFVSLAVALAALADVLVLSPQFAAQHSLARDAATRAADLAALRARAVALQAPGDSAQQRLQQELAVLQTERQALQAQIDQRLAEGGAQLPALLAQVLRRHERLSLVRLDSAAPADAGEAAAATARPARQVELQVAGRHADLMAYLGEIEQRLPALRWEDVRIDALSQPPRMSLRLALPGAPR